MEAVAAVSILGALAQDTRLAIFRLLVVHGREGLTVGKIGDSVGVPATTLSFHLKELTRANLIVARQEGRFISYVANFEEMDDLLSFLTENCCSAPGCVKEPKAIDLPRKAPEKKAFFAAAKV